jgi:hypothetical protein
MKLRVRIRDGGIAGAPPSFGWIALAILLTCPLIWWNPNLAIAQKEAERGGSSRQAAQNAAPRETWFGDLRKGAALGPNLESAMAKYVAAALDGREPPKDAARVIADAKRAPRIVFLSLGDERGPAGIFRGTGPALQPALDAAILSARSADGAAGRRWRKIDVVDEVVPYPNITLPGFLRVERGVDGLAFENGSGLAFLPDEILARSLADNSGAVQPKRVATYLSRSRPELAPEFARLTGAGPLTLYRFTTRSFLIDADQAVPLFRGHRIFTAVPPEELISSAAAGGQYLVRIVDETGRFEYSYLPKTETTRDEYNILRHAGTTYSLLEVHEVTGDQEVLGAARRALEYLVTVSKPITVAGETLACVVEDGDATLGGNGLACLALAKYIEVTGDREWLPLLRRLAGWMRSVQTGNGYFAVHKQAYPNGPVSDFRSDYYSGEAAFALVRVFEVDPDPAWLDAAERGARYMIQADEGKTSKNLRHDHWLLYTLGELYAHRPQPIVLEHAQRIAASIVESQNRKPEIPDWAGSYSNPPRTTPTATRSEGLCAAWWLARNAGDKKAADRILEALRLGVAFQLQCQFRPESAMYLDAPARAMGGFRETLTDYEIRIDFVQHNISALLGLARILGEVQGPQVRGEGR